MSFIKRAWLSLTRKPVKSMLLFLTLLLVSTILFSVTSIERASEKQSSEYLESGKLGFILRNNPNYAALGPRGMGIIPTSVIDSIRETEGIIGVNRKLSKIATLVDVKSVKLQDNPAFDQETEDLYGQVVTLYGEDDTSKDLSFSIDTLTLKEGRHLTEKDSSGVLIHEDLAKMNGLSLGSSIKAQAVNHPEENPYGATEVLPLEVVGIFSGGNPQMATSNMELSSNSLYMNVESVQKILKIPEDKLYFQDATFFAKDQKSMKKALERVKELNIDPDILEVQETTEITMGITETLGNMNKMIRNVKLFAFILSVILLTVMSFIWGQDRKREVGTFLAVGIKKKTLPFSS